MNRKGVVIPIVLLMLSLVSIYAATFYIRSVKEVKRTGFVLEKIQSNLYMKSLEQLIKTKIYSGPGFFRLLADSMVFCHTFDGKQPVPIMGSSSYYGGDWLKLLPDLMNITKQPEDFRVFYNVSSDIIDKNMLIKDVNNNSSDFYPPLTTFLSDLNLNDRVDTSKFVLSVKMPKDEYPTDDELGINIRGKQLLTDADQYFTAINCEMQEFVKQNDGTINEKQKDFSFLFKLNLPQD